VLGRGTEAAEVEMGIERAEQDVGHVERAERRSSSTAANSSP
jgi:hypothetical protein